MADVDGNSLGMWCARVEDKAMRFPNGGMPKPWAGKVPPELWEMTKADYVAPTIEEQAAQVVTGMNRPIPTFLDDKNTDT